MKSKTCFISCRLLAALWLLLAMTAANTLTVFAANASITSFSIDVSYETFLNSGCSDEDDVTVTVLDGGHYHVEDKTMLLRPRNNWTAGAVPRFKLTLEAENGYSFGTECTRLKDAKDWVSGDVKVTSVSRSRTGPNDNNSYLYIVMDLAEVEYDEDDESFTGPGAIKKSGTGPGSANPNAGRNNGAWLYDKKNGWWFVNPDGSRTKNGWQYIDNKWYWFNQYGYMLQSSWILYKNKWYYCGENGDMYTYRFTPDGYWVDKNGEWIPGYK